MKKKKSYMDRKNIVSEGFYTKLLSLFVPKKIKKSFNKFKLDSVNNQIEILDKNIQKLKDEQEKAFNDGVEAIEKATGVKVKNKKFIRKKLDI